MATRTKTVEYWFPTLATIADASATALSQITLYLPENSKSFKSVMCETVVADQQTTSTSITQRQMSLTLQGASASVVNNTSSYTHSGENIIHVFSQDFTTYFNSNWAGTSMTLDGAITINTFTTGSANASVRMVITYQYDDTSTTHVKTVRIPLNAPRIALATTKPAVIDTIPALDTYCPEAGKTFRQTAIVIQGNQESATTIDSSISFEIDSSGVITSTAYEKGLNTSSFYRFSDVVSFTTNATHDFFIWASVTDFDHPQVYLVVTYEFDPSSTTTVLNSLQLPMEFGGTMGGTSSSDYQRAKRELWIEEGGTITTLRVALFVFWDQLAVISGLNARVGTGSFLSYTSVASVLAGNCALMVRNDGAFTLARGRNTLTADIYRADATDLGFSLSSFWLINYTSAKHADGVGAHNHTVTKNLKATGTGGAANQSTVTNALFDIPETNHFKNGIGVNYVFVTNGGVSPSGILISTERLASGEGGLIWENAFESLGGTDPETGIRQCWASTGDIFRRWLAGSVADADENRLDIGTARRWRLSSSAVTFDHLDIAITYHSITFTISGTISGSAGGTVNLALCRASTGEVVMRDTRTGNGAYSFTWFDDTEDMFVVATETASLRGVSKEDLPATDFDINLDSSGGGGGGGTQGGRILIS
jgi:hypothetical protein